jgi:hypothetical protein
VPSYIYCYGLTLIVWVLTPMVWACLQNIADDLFDTLYSLIKNFKHENSNKKGHKRRKENNLGFNFMSSLPETLHAWINS